MIKLGENQELYIVKFADFGAYLNDEEGVTEQSILLPKKQVPEGAKSETAYPSSSTRIQKTVRSPRLPILSLRWDIWLSSKSKKSQISARFWTGDWKKTCSSRLKSRPPRSGRSFLSGQALYRQKPASLCFHEDLSGTEQ